MSGRLLRIAQRVFVGREVALARRWQVKMEDSSDTGRRAFAKALSVTPGVRQVVLGAMKDVRGEWKWIGRPTESLLRHHAAIAGGTGTGKTSWIFGVLMQLADENRHPIILYDAKGETAELVLNLLVPRLVDMDGGEELLERLRVVRVFDPHNVPLLNITLPEPGVPKEAQAYGIASALEQALAELLGGRMHHVLIRCATLCIELDLPITQLQEWLANPKSFLRDAEQSADSSLREYARTGWPQENRESLRALSARLNALLFWPDARLALCAPGAISFADALAQPGITVIDVGSPPAGAERLARFFGAALLGKVVRAILSRAVTPETPPAIFVAEEIQETLGPEEARQLGRLLATARFKRTAVWLVNQSRSQLSAVDPGLVAAMRTNIGVQVQFRTSPEDAAALAYMLPDDGKGEAARRDLIGSLTRLPQRHCYFAIRDADLKAQLVLAPRIDFAALREQGERLSQSLRQRINLGIAAIPRSELQDPPAHKNPVVEELDSRISPESTAPGDCEFPSLG